MLKLEGEGVVTFNKYVVESNNIVWTENRSIISLIVHENWKWGWDKSEQSRLDIEDVGEYYRRRIAEGIWYSVGAGESVASNECKSGCGVCV